MSVVRASISCRETPSDIDSFLRIVNAKLATMFNKYNLPKIVKRRERGHTPRVIEETVRELDGETLLLFVHDVREFEEVIVDYLFNLRDFLASGKLSIDLFTRYASDLAAAAALRSHELYRDIKDLLRSVGCDLSLSLMDENLSSVPDDMLSEVLSNLSVVFGARASDVVKVRVKVIKNGEPVPNISVAVTNQAGGVEGRYEVKSMTNEEGVVEFIARKFSIFEIQVGDSSKSIIIGNKDREVEIEIKEKVTHTKKKTGTNIMKYIAMIAAVAGSATLVYVLWFLSR